MTSENTIRKAVQIISVAALTIVASGCAPQGGGSKVEPIEQPEQALSSNDVTRVCDQAGAKMACWNSDREVVRQDYDDLLETMRYNRDY